MLAVLHPLEYFELYCVDTQLHKIDKILKMVPTIKLHGTDILFEWKHAFILIDIIFNNMETPDKKITIYYNVTCCFSNNLIKYIKKYDLLDYFYLCNVDTNKMKYYKYILKNNILTFI